MKSKSNFLLLAACLGILGCGPVHHDERLHIDPAFEEYFDRFVNLSALNGGPLAVTDLIIEFRRLDAFAALCQTEDGETPMISVDPLTWTQLNSTDRQNVIHHEIGHCVLRRNHQEGEIADIHGSPIPDSLMNSNLVSSATFLLNRDYFERELFLVSNQY